MGVDVGVGVVVDVGVDVDLDACGGGIVFMYVLLKYILLLVILSNIDN